MDFITDLPPSKGFDTILTVVDRFTKMDQIFPCVMSINRQETANIIMCEVLGDHGLLGDIISDRGPQYISHFWKHLWAGLKISYKLFFVYHPQINDQTKCTNQTLKQYR